MKNNAQTITNTADKTTNAKKQKVQRKEVEANARRKIAQNWSKVSKSVKYKKATVRVACTMLHHI